MERIRNRMIFASAFGLVILVILTISPARSASVASLQSVDVGLNPKDDALHEIFVQTRIAVQKKRLSMNDSIYGWYRRGIMATCKTPPVYGSAGPVNLVIQNSGSDKSALTLLMTSGVTHGSNGTTFNLVRTMLTGSEPPAFPQSYPQASFDKAHNETYYDFVAYDDSKGLCHEIAHDSFARDVLWKATAVKIIILVNYDSLSPGDSGYALVKILSSVSNMIANVEKYRDSIVLVVENVNESWDIDVTMKTVVEALKHASQQITSGETHKAVDETTRDKVRLVLDELLMKKDEKYSKIGLLRWPAGDGRDLSPLQEMETLRSVISNGASFTCPSKGDFQYGLFRKAELDASRLTEQTRNRVATTATVIYSHLRDTIYTVSKSGNCSEVLQYLEEAHWCVDNITRAIERLEIPVHCPMCPQEQEFVQSLQNIPQDLEYLMFLQDFTNDYTNRSQQVLLPLYDVDQCIIDLKIGFLSLMTTFDAVHVSRDAMTKLIANTSSHIFSKYSVPPFRSLNFTPSDFRALFVEQLKGALPTIVKFKGMLVLETMNGAISRHVMSSLKESKDMVLTQDELHRASSCISTLAHHLNRKSLIETHCSLWPEGEPLLKDFAKFLDEHRSFFLSQGINTSFADFKNSLSTLSAFFNETRAVYDALVQPWKVLAPAKMSCTGKGTVMTKCTFSKIMKPHWAKFFVEGNTSLPTPSLHNGLRSVESDLLDAALHEKSELLRDIRYAISDFSSKVVRGKRSVSLKKMLLRNASDCTQRMNLDVQTYHTPAPCESWQEMSYLGDTLQRFSKLVAFVKFLRDTNGTFSVFGDDAMKSLQEPMDDLAVQYEYLEHLHDRLVDRRSKEYYEVSDNEIQTVGMTDGERNDTRIQSLLGLQSSDIVSQPLEAAVRLDLEDIVHQANRNTSVNLTEDKVIISGYIVKLSRVQDFCSPKWRTILVFAVHTVVIDSNLNCVGIGLRLAIIAPRWLVQGDRVINLDGSNKTLEAPEPARPGAPGVAGGPGGTLLGFGLKFENLMNLTFFLNGGDGGKGTDGAPGSDGSNGKDKDPLAKGSDRELIDGCCVKLSEDWKHTGLWKSIKYECPGEKGQVGGRGGDGGAGGEEGLPGELKLYKLTTEEFLSATLKAAPGERGIDGMGASGGKGGKDGNALLVDQGVIEVEQETKAVNSKAPDGERGSDGMDTKGMKHAEPPSVFRDVHQVINDYRFWLLDDFNKSILEGTVTSRFLHRMYEVPVAHTYLNSMGFVTELRKLEEKYYLSGQPQSFLPLYKSLLERVVSYGGQILKPDNLLFHTEMAIRSRIVSMRSALEPSVVVDILEYLRVAKTSMEDFKDSLKTQKRLKVNSRFKSAIIKKIESNSQFLNDQLRPAVEDLALFINKTESELEVRRDNMTNKAEKIHIALVSAEHLRGVANVIVFMARVFSITISCISSLFSVPIVGPAFTQATMLTWSELQEVGKVESKLSAKFAAVRKAVRFSESLVGVVDRLSETVTKLRDVRSVMDFRKWWASDSFRNVKKEILLVSIEVPEAGDSCQYALELVEGAANSLLDVFETIDKYEDQLALSDLVSQMASPETLEVEDEAARQALADLHITVSCNLVLAHYANVMAGLKQWAFPFAVQFEELMMLPRYSLANDSAVLLVSAAIERMRALENDLALRRTMVREQDSLLYSGSFGVELGNASASSILPPFAVWPREEYAKAIEQLLGGREVSFTADILSARFYLNAVRFKEVGIALYSADPTTHRRLQSLLQRFQLRMLHHGLSFYRCGKRVYSVSSATVLIEQSFRRINKDPEVHNEAFAKLQQGDAVLSPYATWTLKLVPQRNASFSELQALGSEVDVHLIGRGTYVAGHKCEAELDSLYSLQHVTTSNKVVW